MSPHIRVQRLVEEATPDQVSAEAKDAGAGALTTSTYDVANQLINAIAPSGITTFTFDAAGNQQIEQAPSGITDRLSDVRFPAKLLSVGCKKCVNACRHRDLQVWIARSPERRDAGV